MRQVDILAVLKAHDGPMTTTEIVQALDLEVTPNHRAEAHNRLRTLLQKKMVRKVGHTDQHNRTLWEVAE